jgi:hypothetical protein
MEATPYKGEEFKNSPSTATVPEYSIPFKGPQAAVNRRNAGADMGVVYGEKGWQAWAQDLND